MVALGFELPVSLLSILHDDTKNNKIDLSKWMSKLTMTHAKDTAIMAHSTCKDTAITAHSTLQGPST